MRQILKKKSKAKGMIWIRCPQMPETIRPKMDQNPGSYQWKPFPKWQESQYYFLCERNLKIYFKSTSYSDQPQEHNVGC